MGTSHPLMWYHGFDGVFTEEVDQPMPGRRMMQRTRAAVSIDVRATWRRVVVLVALFACSLPASTGTTPEPASGPLAPVPPMRAGMHPRLNTILDSIVQTSLVQGAAPGAALAVGRHGRMVHMRGYGRIDAAADAAAVTDSTRFDLASLTKVVATTTAAMILEQEGRLDLN